MLAHEKPNRLWNETTFFLRMAMAKMKIQLCLIDE
jgi:hypothetical protein